MKLKESFAGILAVCSLFSVAVTSCSSDPLPGLPINEEPKETAYVSLDLSVASTRADQPNQYATADETKFGNVNIYVFNSEGNLENTYVNEQVNNNKTRKFTTTPGVKTIYAISANTNTYPKVPDKITKADFEKFLIPSTIKDLTKTSETECFAMIGKVESKNVIKSSSADNMPAGNTFAISLVRLAAKAQVICGTNFETSASQLGFSAENAQFSIRQTADQMRLMSADQVITDFEANTNTNGTYNGYTFNPFQTTNGNGYLPCGTEFTAENCHYMAENIVNSPVSGNATFACIKVQMVPQKVYTYPENKLKDAAPLEESNGSYPSFFTLCKRNDATGTVDYVMDSNNSIICFADQASASNYKESNNDYSSHVVCQFTNCEVYYRVNIVKKGKNEDMLCRIDRNTFYKITLNSLNSLGFNEERGLCPTVPTTPVTVSNSAWIDASISVEDWITENQSSDL